MSFIKMPDMLSKSRNITDWSEQFLKLQESRARDDGSLDRTLSMGFLFLRCYKKVKYFCVTTFFKPGVFGVVFFTLECIINLWCHFLGTQLR